MCGRYRLINEPHRIAEFSRVRMAWVPRPRYNIAPGQMIRVLLDAAPDRVSEVQWGLIPSWCRDRRTASRTVNARSETAARKPAFRNAWRSQHCLIPADGYYEWTVDGRQRIPWMYTLTSGDFVFAGLWDSWRDPAAADDDPPLLTATILTCAPNSLAARLHDRMPVILPPETWEEWLDPATRDERRRELMRPYPEDEMQVARVSRLVNSVRNEGPALLEPDDDGMLPGF